jgi:glycosyltransferase involved in cell wall biosynthesis
MIRRNIGLLLINGPLPPPFGGVATYLAHALPYLAQRDFTIHTVIDSKPVGAGLYRSFEESGVHIHFGGGTRFQKASRLLKHTPLWVSTLRHADVERGIFLKTMKSVVSWIDAAEQVLNHHPIDIIHAYDYPWVQGFVAAHLAKKHRKKYVQTTFGEVVPHQEELVHHDKHGDRYKGFVKHVLQQADLIISLSRHCASEVEFIGVPRERVQVMYWGVDTNHFHPKLDGREIRQQYELGDAPVVLFLGQVRPRKGPQVVLEAMPSIVHRHPNAKYLVVGPDYGLVEQLKRRAQELGVDKNVLFTGGKPHGELPAFYAASDIFVFPTCTPIECLGLSMIQAMACGKPVVGSRINGIPEVIVDGETGFLVEPNSALGCADSIITLLGDSTLRERMGVAGRARAVNQFNQDVLVRELEEAYRSIMSRSEGI